MTQLLRKIENLTWFNLPNVLKEILKLLQANNSASSSKE